MVKADAYNHGVEMVVKATEDIVEKFGVATADEGIELRRLGIKNDIIVTAFCCDELQKVVFYGLIPVINDFESLKSLAKNNLKIPIDIKLDTGMNRLGFKTEDEIKAVIKLIKENNLNIRAISTHFYSDKLFEIEQQERLLNVYNTLFNKEGLFPKIHCANSIGHLYGKNYDEIRIGILAYGYGENSFLKVMTVKDIIVKIKYLKKGEKLGYGGLFIAEKNVKIGIIRCGYYDGIMRSYKDTEVIINAKRRKIVGNVCMDMFFVELSDEDKLGDEVTIFPIGEQKEIEEQHKTIVYELITNFKGRNKRIYYL